MMSHLLISQPPIQVLPALAEAVGFNEAVVLQLTHFWLRPLVNPDFKDGCHWVQNLAFHLQGHFPFWGVDDIGYMVAQLEQSGILTVRYEEPSEGVPLSWHTINYDQLEGLAPEPGNLAPDIPFTPDSPMEKANSNMRTPFRATLHDKGNNIYIMAVEDMRHFLSCELTLEVQAVGALPDKPEGGVPSPGETAREVVCHFPRIADGEFLNFVWDDPTLYIVLKDEFLMKIMEQLLLFCAAHHAGKLTLFSDDPKEADLEIYRKFLTSMGQPAPKAEGAGLIIPVLSPPHKASLIPSTSSGSKELAGTETLDAWKAFMEQTRVEFQQTLWRERKGNPAVRHYLNNQDWPE